MRYALAAAMSVGLVLALAACGQSKSGSAAGPTNSPSPTAEASAGVQPQIVAGQVKSATATQLTIASQGKTETVDLTPQTVIMAAHKGTLADIKPGSFIGTTNVPNGDGVGSSTEVHIFPPGIKMGEGDRPMGPAPGSGTASRMTNGTVSSAGPATGGSRMTNGAVGAVSGGAGGVEMDVAYQGGKRHIIVSPKTPVQVMSLASPRQLTKGTAVVLGVVPGSGESKTATFVNIQS
jgi:hypothetical protein